MTSGAGNVVVGPESSETNEPSPYPGSVSEVVELPPHAASAKPRKLGLQEGQVVTFKDAILADRI
jgi:hypothetical protein